MQVLTDLSQWQALRRGEGLASRSLGLVPTMGNLHAGHVSLLDRARAENDLAVLTIFVNATQFDNRGDLASYPRTLEADLVAAEAAGVDYVLCPTYEQIYPDDYRFVVTEKSLSRRFCGAHRPEHFDGVLTVVLKLLLLVRPRRAYFGEKDYQQFLLVRDMAAAFFLESEIVPCPLVRDTDGLALSSRNRNLSPSERRHAADFPRLLRTSRSAAHAAAALTTAGFQVDYVEDFEGRRLAAVHLGAVRLIDNVPLEKPSSGQ